MKAIIFSLLMVGSVQFSFQASACESDQPKAASVKNIEGIMLASAVPLAGGSCVSTSDCAPGENCINGICKLAGGPGSCLGDVDCAVGERCVNGNCQK